MEPLAWVDDLYAAFCSALPGELGAHARRLACTLKLAPTPAVPWSQVFGHEVTLAAPAVMAEAMRGVPTQILLDAVLAHMLAVIEAFGTDRIEDGQVTETPELRGVLAALRAGREEALARVAPGVIDPAMDCARADAETRAAIAAERALLACGEAVDMAGYEATSIGKQAVGFPASIALAHAAGWSDRRRATLSRALADVWIGLQLHDDVMDWEEDLERGGAWAVSLARGVGQREPAGKRKTVPPLTRRFVHGSGVLALMLARSRRRFRAASRRARALGAHRLAGWAAEREAHLAELVANERRSAGFANRAHALAAWAREVLG